MSKRSEIFDKVLYFYQHNRKSGTTTYIKEALKQNDAWVLSPNSTSFFRESFGKNMVSIGDNIHFRQKNPKPILVDNYTMIKLMGTASMDIKQ